MFLTQATQNDLHVLISIESIFKAPALTLKQFKRSHTATKT